jgi:predicted RNA methylase
MRVDNEVMAVLSMAQTDGNALTLVGQLDRKLYERTNKVLEAAGGKWNRKAKAHLFDDGAAERIDQILLTGSIEIPKDEFEFFPTPAIVVGRLLELADVRAGMLVLEPEAGRGNIAFACADVGAIVDCVELMDANYTALTSDPRIHSVLRADFLALLPEANYDRIVMNPPFSKQADIKHVNHALKFLKPDGLLVAVMSSGVTFRDNKLTTEFRDLIRARGGDIEALPEDSFKSSGTSVNTVIVTIPGEEV